MEFIWSRTLCSGEACRVELFKIGRTNISIAEQRTFRFRLQRYIKKRKEETLFADNQHFTLRSHFVLIC